MEEVHQSSGASSHGAVVLTWGKHWRVLIFLGYNRLKCLSNGVWAVRKPCEPFLAECSCQVAKDDSDGLCARLPGYDDILVNCQCVQFAKTYLRVIHHLQVFQCPRRARLGHCLKWWAIHRATWSALIKVKCVNPEFAAKENETNGLRRLRFQDKSASEVVVNTVTGHVHTYQH